MRLVLIGHRREVDLLGLGALNVVHRAFDLVERHTGETLSLATLPPDDAPTFELIQRGDTVVFWFPGDPTKSYIKRVIGVPGDTVEVKSPGIGVLKSTILPADPV